MGFHYILNPPRMMKNETRVMLNRSYLRYIVLINNYCVWICITIVKAFLGVKHSLPTCELLPSADNLCKQFGTRSRVSKNDSLDPDPNCLTLCWYS